MEIKEAKIEDVLIVHAHIPEFVEMPAERSVFEPRYAGIPHCIFVAYSDSLPVGYLIGYEVDATTAYCWMAGVMPDYRKCGALTGLTSAFENWMHSRGYTLFTIKTRNNRREMRRFLAKAGFNITKVEEMPNVEDNRIYLEKEI